VLEAIALELLMMSTASVAGVASTTISGPCSGALTGSFAGSVGAAGACCCLGGVTGHPSTHWYPSQAFPSISRQDGVVLSIFSMTKKPGISVRALKKNETRVRIRARFCFDLMKQSRCLFTPVADCLQDPNR
jgi:hypothetical protein